MSRLTATKTFQSAATIVLYRLSVLSVAVNTDSKNEWFCCNNEWLTRRGYFGTTTVKMCCPAKAALFLGEVVQVML